MQRLVSTSRTVGALYEFAHEGISDDLAKVKEKLDTRHNWIWELPGEVERAKKLTCMYSKRSQITLLTRMCSQTAGIEESIRHCISYSRSANIAPGPEIHHETISAVTPTSFCYYLREVLWLAYRMPKLHVVTSFVSSMS